MKCLIRTTTMTTVDERFHGATVYVSILFLVVILTAAVATAFAQVPVADLAKPPADARHFVIQSSGGKHGDSWSWVAPDGTRMGRESMNLRGQVFELDSSGRAGADGMLSRLTIRGMTPQGDAAETFSLAAGTARWKSQVDDGTAPYASPAFYVSQGGPVDTTAWFLEALLASPDKTLALLPGGKAHADEADRPPGRLRLARADDHALGHHRHQHLSAAGLGGQQQQVLRGDLRDCVAARGVCRRAEEARGGPG